MKMESDIGKVVSHMAAVWNRRNRYETRCGGVATESRDNTQ